MLKVLIADDERKVGLLVKNLIQWDALQLELLDLVQDGQTAYEIILKRKPDIVITDIRMPGLSGLDMIQRVTSAGLKIHFIVISGYRYFEYAQTALKYGVKDYLLKPIDEEELNRILQKICAEIIDTNELQTKVQNLEKNLASSRHILHREIMEQVFGQDAGLKNEIECELEKNNDEHDVFFAFAIKVDRELGIERNKEQEELIRHKLTDFIYDQLELVTIDLVISDKDNMWKLCLLNYEQEQSEIVQECLQTLYRKMYQYISDFNNYEITIGVGCEIFSFSKINLIIEMAREAVNGRIFNRSNGMVLECSRNKNLRLKGQDIVQEYEELLIKNIHVFKQDEVSSLIRRIFDELKQEDVLACEYYDAAKSIFEFYAIQIETEFGENMDEKINEWQEAIDNCRNILDMKLFLIRTISQSLFEIEKKQSNLERKPILNTLEYIKEHYASKILLEDVAAMYGFNANYFSEIFKKETGKNFSTYLLEIRMEKAKELLKNTQKTIYEISAEVGYKDSKFFSQQFTKTIGIKPNEYRRLYY